MSVRNGWISAAFAVYGATLAIGIAPALQPRVRPGALPSGIASAGLDPSGPIRQLALVVVLAFVFAAASTLVMRFIVERRWAAWTASIALASAPITLMHFGSWRHVLMHGAVAAAVVFLRRFDPRFSRADVVLIPVVLSFYFAFLDTGFGRTPAATFLRAAIVTLGLRIAVGIIARLPRPGYAFAAAPLAFVLQMQWIPPAIAGILAVVWLIATPLALARTIDEARLRRFAMWIAYPVAVAAYALALLNIAGPPHIDFFEDGHDLQPASEYLHGKRPYSGIVPIHGVMSDGGLGWLVIKLGGDSAGAVLKTRLVFAALTVAAIYFVALAATGSAEGALLAAFLAYALLPAAAVWMRALFPLAGLACTIASVRLRNPRWMIGAGVALLLSCLFSLDLAIDSAIVALIVAFRARDRFRSLKLFGLGFGAAAVPALSAFAVGGFFVDFFRVTLTDVFGARGAYVVAPLAVPDCLRSLTGVIVFLDDRICISFLVWVLALAGSAAAIARSPLRARRRDAVWLIGVWIVVAGTSYVERQHFYFDFAVAAFLASLLYTMLRGRYRQAAIVVTLLVVLLARPFEHIFDLATPLRRNHGLPMGDAGTFTGSRRAAGVVFDGQTLAALQSTQRFLFTLRPGDTFVDFANAGLLYYLFDRQTPIRYMNVLMYESDAAQREVISSLERQHVAAALIVFPTALSNVDDVPNRNRAPLVWNYLQTHYAPALNENGVVFWRRKLQ